MDDHRRIYHVWWEMKRRCFDSSNIHYKNYGGRGITVSDEWMDFNRFMSDMGERPKHSTIERINNNLGYSKDNCKWSTDRSEQSLNRRKFITNKTGIKNVEFRNDGNFRVRFRRKSKIIFDKTVSDFFDACCLAKSCINKLEAM